jgi:carbon monoxide dehydrogenase subunit G
MTQQKKLKKAIRARSEKTGESYTAARRQLLLARDKKAATSQPSPAPEPQPAPPAAAAMAPALPPSAPPAPRAAAPTRGATTDAATRKKTGHGLDHWFAVLDSFGAAAKGHTAAAAHLYEAHGIPGWYAQGITVAYERARGLREMNQSCAGTFQVSVSKTVPVPVAEVVDALKDPERRAAWLAGADPGLVQAIDAAFSGEKPREVKTKGDGYAWVRFPWPPAKVEIRITGKPKGASVVADNTDLAGAEQVEQRRAQWREALEGLQRHLGG